MILQPFLQTFLFPGAIIDGDVSNKFSNFNDIIGPVINGHAPNKSVKSATVSVLIIPAKLKRFEIQRSSNLFTTLQL